MASAKTRRRLGAAARREGILAVALPEFARHGYDRTRVADIAAQVGVTEPVVFQNFGSKADLFAAVLDQAARQAESGLQMVFGSSTDVREGLANLLSPEYQDQLHSPGALGAVFAEAADHPEPAIREAGHRAHLRWVSAMAEFLRPGQAAGFIRSDIDPAAISGLILSLVHARHFRRALGRTSAALERDLVAAVVDSVVAR
jgi:AcrR family transcriptional regulator